MPFAFTPFAWTPFAWTPYRKTIPVWVWVSLWWIGYALIYATHIVGMRDETNRLILWSDALRISYAGWLTHIPVSLVLLWLVRRYPFRSGKLLRSMALYSVVVAVLIAAKAAYIVLTNSWIHWYTQYSIAGVVMDSVRNNLLLYCMMIGVAHAFLYFESNQVREREVLALGSQLKQAKLDALATQLNPHFLFNALNSIAELVHHDANAADQMLVALSNLLRRSLSASQEHTLTVRAEVDFLEHYLAIERVRLGPRLRMTFDISEDCWSAQMPVMVLQSLLENAIVHGISKRAAGGSVVVQVQRLGVQLILSVTNELAASQPQTPGFGIGLSNIGARLECLYGAAFSLISETHESNIYTVTLRFPFQTQSTTPLLSDSS